MVHRLDFAPSRPNEDEFEAEPVLAADNAFLILVVIGRGAQMAENELGDPDIIFGMFRHVDAVPVIEERDGAVGGVHKGLNVGHDALIGRFGLQHANDVVATVHDALVKELV